MRQRRRSASPWEPGLPCGSSWMRSAADRDRLHLLGCGFDGQNDVLVSRAAAQVADDAMADLRVCGTRSLAQQLDRADDHAGRAEPTLQPMLFPECLLHWVQPVVGSETFDSHDSGAVSLYR